ncbi:MAG: Site-specific DNA methylase [Candidatus Nomurabacteria bacterium GW2011_GWC2_36_9]|uniref:DNA (cytosine-5-)-methyltransferase n=1 Tax=candidate division WS6 bacterium GW2011_GWF1_36_8 TaxID=1619098 RepID=A0A0G0FNK0_9BACT|nr:MAG: Site-specific DNA methylase [candidate division WS6 bacterium GW2011_GWF1_36_8]KKQ19336.1 MAG: Site-specific DNA methylase [Candidatus Nomurabacteria bacterium GW2011_GWC2_36_9]
MKPQHLFEEIKLGPLMLHLNKGYDVANGRMIFWIDLFAGAGGTTTGIHLAGLENVKVVACVNHDHNALMSHWHNHPDCMHFVEDVRDFKVVVALSNLVAELRSQFPECVINLWASLECTNYSKAKGGLPRDADSRTLAHALFMYIEELQPDYVYIENVREFMSWGPLDEKGRPISKLNGRDYLRWIKELCSYGYQYDYQLINSADHGAYTSRERYFGQFAKIGLPMKWPETTHSKSPDHGGLFGAKAKWKPVREVLDLEDEGRSIFTRKKPLSEKTLERIYAGLVKFVAGGEDLFTIRYNGGDMKEKSKSVLNPLGAIATSNRHGLIKSVFLSKYYSGHPESKNISVNQPAGSITTKDSHSAVFLSHYYGNGFNTSLDDPCPTITTKERVAKIESQFIQNYYSGGGQLGSIEQPNPTITGVPKQRLTTINFMDQQYGHSKPSSIEEPAGTITSNPKLNLISAEHFLLNPQYANKGGSLDKPCFTLIARMDKMPPYIVAASSGKIFAMPIFERECATMQKIRMFMAIYGIVDIKMRMLIIDELLRIQGFPDGYKLEGTQTEQKKFIGNAVVPVVAKALVKSNSKAIEIYYNKIAV